VCDGDCTDLDLALRDASGNILDEDTEESDVSLASVLLDSGGTLQLEVSMWSCSVEPGGILTQYRPILRQGWRAVTLFKDVAWPSTVGILTLGDTITKDWFGPGGVIVRYPRTLAALVFAVAGLTTGCASAGGGSVRMVDRGMPEWMLADQAAQGSEVGNRIVGRGTGESTSLDVARGIARAAATAEIQQYLRQELGGLNDLLREQAGELLPEQFLGGVATGGVLGVTETFTAAVTQLLDGELFGVRETQTEILRDESSLIHTVYVLMEQDSGAQLEQVMRRMAQARDYALFRKTEVFEDLEERRRAYRERRNR
jgi:hypothetical protein